MARPSARPASPRRVMGKPSSVEATEEGVPGTLSRMAGTAPPATAPQKAPSNMPIPTSGGKPKVSGINRAIAMVAVSPGSTHDQAEKGSKGNTEEHLDIDQDAQRRNDI